MMVSNSLEERGHLNIFKEIHSAECCYYDFHLQQLLIRLNLDRHFLFILSFFSLFSQECE